MNDKLEKLEKLVDEICEGEDGEYKRLMVDIVKEVEEYEKHSKEWKKKKSKGDELMKNKTTKDNSIRLTIHKELTINDGVYYVRNQMSRMSMFVERKRFEK